MSFFKSTNDINGSWESILKKYGFYDQTGFNLTIKDLEFSSSFIPGGFPTELILKNSQIKVVVYDSNMENKVGESSINYSKDSSSEDLFVRSILTKEQFNYLFQLSISQKKLYLQFVTPWFGLDKIKNLSLTKPIIFNNCTFMIFKEPPKY